MKNKILLLALTTIFFSCKETKDEITLAEEKIDYAVFGDSISSENALTIDEMALKYENLKEGDTLDVTFKSKSIEVCQSKGCWMTMDLGEEKTAFIKFKDYGFFVPLNGQDKESVVKGKAFVSVESVDELKHYALDAGKSQAAIDSIIAPEVTYSFIANGVLMRK